MDLAFQWIRTCGRKTDHVQSVLDELLNLVHDAAVLKTNRNPRTIQNKDLTHLLEKVASQKSLAALLDMFDAVHRTKAALKYNANAQLSLENMFLNFCEAA
jgi:DNA polymerase III gamma/tau subunit